MTPEDFRRHGHEIVDWLADYYNHIGDYPVVPAVRPGDIRAQLPQDAPESPQSFDQILTDFRNVIVPGMTHWGHPGWFAYFPSNSSPPSVLGEFLAAGLGAQCMSWVTSPAATELEQVVMEWYRKLLALPDGFTGVIQDTASSATLMAFLTARAEKADHSDRLVAYWSREAHSSVSKASRLTAMPHSRVIEVDGEYAMRVDALDAALREDIARGLVPAIVVATLGTTSSTACDPLRAIGQLARQAGAWFHVDAAFGGSAAIVPELRPLLDGVELADSMVTNPHKWLMTNFDCSAYFVRDVDALLRTFASSPEYLRTAHDRDTAAVNYRDWGIPLGRRFRALKLWFVLQSYGAAELRAMIRRHIDWGKRLAQQVVDAPHFELLAPAPLGLVCLRHVPGNLEGDEQALARHNARLMQCVNSRGSVHLTHTTLAGRYAIRVAIGSFRTQWEDVARLWSAIVECATQAG